jgi:hypothetical protein
MAIDIGTQIIIVLAFGIMAILTKRNFPDISRYFGWTTLIIFALFSIVDIIDALKLIG